MKNDLYDIIDERNYFFPLDFLSSLDEFMLQKKIVLPYYDRLSHKNQWGNDADRLACVKEESARHNVIISKVFSEIANGRASHLDGRYELMKALQYARENDCWLIGPSVSRFIRSEEYAQDNQQIDLRKKDLIPFVKLLDGVRIATIIPPMTPFSVERGIFSKWGQSGKGNKGGRSKTMPPGYKKERRLECEEFVQRWRERGMPYREIAGRLSKIFGWPINFRTVYDWVNKPADR